MKLEKWNNSRKTPHTRTALAVLLGVSRTTLYRWIAGEPPTRRYTAVLRKVTGNKVKRTDWKL